MKEGSEDYQKKVETLRAEMDHLKAEVSTTQLWFQSLLISGGGRGSGIFSADNLCNDVTPHGMIFQQSDWSCHYCSSQVCTNCMC